MKNAWHTKQTSQQPTRYLTELLGTTAKFTCNINHPMPQESSSLVPSNGINTDQRKKRNKTCCHTECLQQNIQQMFTQPSPQFHLISALEKKNGLLGVLVVTAGFGASRGHGESGLTFKMSSLSLISRGNTLPSLGLLAANMIKSCGSLLRYGKQCQNTFEDWAIQVEQLPPHPSSTQPHTHIHK